MKNISKKDLSLLDKKLLEIEEKLELPSKRERLKELENLTSSPHFWKEPEEAQAIMSKIKSINQEINKYNQLKDSLDTVTALFEEMPNDQSLVDEYINIEKGIDEFETLKFLSGKYDGANAIFSIHSGQGGTEANDWSAMLYRMYTMYFDNKGWTYKVVHSVNGNETGLSTITLEVNGPYAYGLLKMEHGTHRLVRLSPFNAQNLRQTSFAGVEVMPELKELDKDIEIPDSDIDFKAVKSGGPGGQNVNKTSSAVQITHIPTGIAVHCSQGRSQLQNRETAMQILKGKLWRILEENRLKEISDIKGDHKIAGWGNQIRNYVLHPYKLVKDLRTGVESSNPESVLDGEIEIFVEAQVRIQ